MAKKTTNGSLINNKDKYEYLIKARNFHYENFSKWLSYFYVAIAALFVGYYSIAKEKCFENKEILELAILILGYLVSLFWYWSSKGYYYWNINFIMLVNYYEIEVFKWRKYERIYSGFANKEEQNKYGNPLKGANISTSKIAILFGYTVSIVWGFILAHKILDKYLIWRYIELLYAASLITAIISIWFLTVFFAKNYLPSFIEHMPNLELKQTKYEEEIDKKD